MKFINAAQLFVIAFTSFASHVLADGLVYGLPADGTWVRYEVFEQGAATLAFPPNVNAPPGLTKAQELPIKSSGSLILRSVGQHDLDGERCRWIELELSVETFTKFPDPATGDLKEQNDKRKITLKMLIPEEYLRVGSDPMAHVRKLYFKDGEENSEIVDDEKAKQYQLDRFRPIFPTPGQNVDKSQIQQVRTHDGELGTLVCQKHTFESTYEGPLTFGRRGWWSWQGKHEVCLNEKVPFGVVSLKYKGESHEWSAEKNQSLKVTSKLTKEIVIAEMGVGATSDLPE